MCCIQAEIISVLLVLWGFFPPADWSWHRGIGSKYFLRPLKWNFIFVCRLLLLKLLISLTRNTSQRLIGHRIKRLSWADVQRLASLLCIRPFFPPRLGSELSLVRATDRGCASIAGHQRWLFRLASDWSVPCSDIRVLPADRSEKPVWREELDQKERRIERGRGRSGRESSGARDSAWSEKPAG